MHSLNYRSYPLILSWLHENTALVHNINYCNQILILLYVILIINNLFRDVLIVTTLDTFTSLLAGITIFGILGNLAHNLNIDDIGKVVESGTGLAFISYPDAISKFDVVPQVIFIVQIQLGLKIYRVFSLFII